HNRLFASVIRAPISFFDTNPIGILLNRISRDLGIIDDILPQTGFNAISLLGNMITTAILIAIVDPWMIIPTVVLTLIMLGFRKFFIGTSRQVKRLEGVTRSPVFSH